MPPKTEQSGTAQYGSAQKSTVQHITVQLRIARHTTQARPEGKSTTPVTVQQCPALPLLLQCAVPAVSPDAGGGDLGLTVGGGGLVGPLRLTGIMEGGGGRYWLGKVPSDTLDTQNHVAWGAQVGVVGGGVLLLVRTGQGTQKREPKALFTYMLAPLSLVGLTVKAVVTWHQRSRAGGRAGRHEEASSEMGTRGNPHSHCHCTATVLLLDWPRSVVLLSLTPN